MTMALRVLSADESGGALIEYALVMALVSMVGLTALTTFGDVLAKVFADSCTTLAQNAVLAK